MFSNEIFIKNMARKIEDDELSEVGGGFFEPKTCHISGMDDGDWTDEQPG